MTDHYIQNEVSKFYRVNNNLNVLGHDDTGIYRLAVHDLGGVQVVLDVDFTGIYSLAVYDLGGVQVVLGGDQVCENMKI